VDRCDGGLGYAAFVGNDPAATREQSVKGAMMNIQTANRDFFRQSILVLAVLAGLSLLGYALVNLIRMPAVSPDAFVPKSAAPSTGSLFGLLQLVFVLGYAFAFLPVSVMFTVKRYDENPYALVLACSLLCVSLVIEIFNSLPFLGAYVYPEPLTSVAPDVMLYLNQTAAIRYLAFDVAGFTILYVALLIYAAVYWNKQRILGYLVLASVITFAASVPALWLSGPAAVVLMALSVLCVAPVPVIFGRMAVESTPGTRSASIKVNVAW
jgi:hypothetical protein